MEASKGFAHTRAHEPPPVRENLQWLARDAKLFPDASVDLVYLDHIREPSSN
jgi:hypothetical protein